MNKILEIKINNITTLKMESSDMSNKLNDVFKIEHIGFIDKNDNISLYFKITEIIIPNSKLSKNHIVILKEITSKLQSLNVKYINNIKKLNPTKVLDDNEINHINIIQHNKINTQKILYLIYKYKNNDICPSVQTLIQHSKLNKDSVHKIKKELENLNILKTDKLKTFILCNYNTAANKINSSNI